MNAVIIDQIPHMGSVLTATSFQHFGLYFGKMWWSVFVLVFGKSWLYLVCNTDFFCTDCSCQHCDKVLGRNPNATSFVSFDQYFHDYYYRESWLVLCKRIKYSDQWKVRGDAIRTSMLQFISYLPHFLYYISSITYIILLIES